MDDDDQLLSRTAREAERDHRHLLDRVRELEALLEESEPAPRVLAERLEALARDIEEHFDREEESPLYNEILERRSEFRDDLRRLLSEHDPMLSMLGDLAREAARASGVALGSPMAIRVREFVAGFRQHEVDEAWILARLEGEG